MVRCLPFLCLVLLFAGCSARKPDVWKFVPEDRGHTLVPPRPNAMQPDFELKRARSVKTNAPACALDKPGIRLQWKGKAARVHADSAALAPLPGTVLQGVGGGAPGQLPADIIVRTNWFQDAFKPALVQQEHEGCIAAQDAPRLTQRLIDSMPLPSSASYRLRYGEYIMAGYFDLEPQFRLRAVEPIREKGVAVGYLTSFYLLHAAAQGGVTVSAGQSESNVRGAITTGIAADHEVMHLPAGATYLRFFFRSWSVDQDRKIALLAAPSAADLEKATKDFEASPESYCAVAGQKGAACISVPKDMVIGPELKVRANGKDEYVPVGGNIADLMRGAGVRDPMAKTATLKVTRPYEGKLAPVEFDHSKSSILSLVLIGGEELTW